MRYVIVLVVMLVHVAVALNRLSRAKPGTLRVLIPFELAIFLVMLIGLTVTLRHLEYRAISRRRIHDLGEQEASPESEAHEPEAQGFLGNWLALAGFRAPGVVGTFIGSTVAMGGAGATAAFLLERSSLFATGLRALEVFPGAIGQIFLPVLYLAPWIIVAILVGTPTLVVRASRRRIVTEVERDLPLVLELLATLGESGLGFDAAIARIVDAQPADRPLTAELRAFQRETLTGRPRIESLRRLARRLDVQSLTIFISAVVQAEQVGAGVADVLRRQADDVRDRRRDRALALAQSLPVKLLFPLIICFLPAILIFTMGPILLEFIKFADAFLSRGSLP